MVMPNMRPLLQPQCTSFYENNNWTVFTNTICWAGNQWQYYLVLNHYAICMYTHAMQQYQTFFTMAYGAPKSQVILLSEKGAFPPVLYQHTVYQPTRYQSTWYHGTYENIIFYQLPIPVIRGTGTISYRPFNIKTFEMSCKDKEHIVRNKQNIIKMLTGMNKTHD